MHPLSPPPGRDSCPESTDISSCDRDQVMSTRLLHAVLAAALHGNIGGEPAGAVATQPERTGDDGDCSYNGKRTAGGACACLPQWRGPHCAELNLVPTARDAGYQPTALPPDTPGKWLPASAGSNVSTWGGPVVHADDGMYHMFASTFVRGCASLREIPPRPPSAHRACSCAPVHTTWGAGRFHWRVAGRGRKRQEVARRICLGDGGGVPSADAVWCLGRQRLGVGEQRCW